MKVNLDNIKLCFRILLFGILLMNYTLWGEEFIKPSEVEQKDRWVKKHLLHLKVKPPFSFSYNIRSSDDLLVGWSNTIEVKKLDDVRTQHSIIWIDPEGILEIRCVAIDYMDFPVIEWSVYFKNIGKVDTPIVKDIQGLDIVFQRGKQGAFILHGIKGEFCAAESYEPYKLKLEANTVKKFSPPPYSGKSSDGPDGWPYFNLQMPGNGVIIAVGWPGQWACSFIRDADNELRVKAGQELTNLYLKPNEEIRTPLIAMLFWQGHDVVRAQNLWRRWYIKHNIPRVNGKPQPPIIQVQGGGGKDDIARVRNLLEAGIKPDVCWRDAGGDYTWYESDGGPYGPNTTKGGPVWLNTGTWEIDKNKYPNGFTEFSDWIHDHGIQFLLWFEPERVGDPNSWLAQNHPEWLLPETSHGSLLDEGNPEALKWLINHIDTMIKTQGIDWYREDMNGEGPLPAWRKNDASNRQGITENFYVQGHLVFWDELRRRNPGLSIDSCASGGRRNDLETMRRAVPLLRSDFEFPHMEGVIEGNQGHTYGLSSWLPFQGTGSRFHDAYSYRSFYGASFGMVEGSPEIVKKAHAESRRVAPYMLLGDYYPLTRYSRQRDQWIGWQFHRPQADAGIIQVFRRSECSLESRTFRLKGLDPDAEYVIINFDSPKPVKLSGHELLENGLTVAIPDKPGAAIIEYNKTDSHSDN